MPLITWSPTLSVGVKQIDDEHKRLVDLLNQLSDAMHAGKGRDVLAPVLAELIKYTRTHFSAEERLMDVHRYAAAAAHKGEHQKLVQDVSEFKARFDSGKVNLSVEMLVFLRDWLNRHILGTDKAFGLALKAKGVA